MADMISTDLKAHVAGLESLLAGRSRGGEPLLEAPGCWDAFSARTAEAAGAAALFLGPQAVAMARYGHHEVSMVTFGELVDLTASIRESASLPLIVDAAGGHGNSLNVYRIVRLFERAGASAITVSDAVIPGSVQEARREAVVTPADMIGKLKAALDSRGDALIIAKTLASRSEGLSAAFDRAEAYLEAGVDMLIVAGAADGSGVEAIAERFAGRVALIHDLGMGPPPAEQDDVLERLGYSAVLMPNVLLSAMAAAAPQATLKRRPQAVQTR